MYFKLLGTLLLVVLAGCSTTEEEPYVEKPVEDLYNKAMDLMEAGKYDKAAENFDEVERQHPYSPWATKAQIMSAYAHYRGQKYDRAIAALEAFTQLHPAHPDVPYALYMTGVSYYEQLGPVARDSKDTEDALRVFNELIRRFPSTDYAKDAKYKIMLLQDSLAGKEMETGRFYLNKKAYQGAINRFQIVATKFQTTSHVEEALYRIVECYLGMGLREEARTVAAVLGHNYSGSPWYAEAYLLVEGKELEGGTQSLRFKEESWLDRLRNWNKGPLKKKSDQQAPKSKELSKTQDSEKVASEKTQKEPSGV